MFHVFLGYFHALREERLAALLTQPAVAFGMATYLWAAAHACVKALPLQSARN